jgi:diguanylate cyclase (GGDEF)-like protein
MDNRRGKLERYFSILNFLFSIFAIVFFLTTAEAGVKFKISASNPSEFNEQKVVVKSYLPKGIQPENVIDAGGLEIGYDVRKGQCYVHTEVLLAVKSSTTYLVEIDDIWLIDAAELEKQRMYTRRLGEELQGSSYAGASTPLIEEIEQKIEAILDNQEENFVEKVSPIEHIGAYELNQQTLVSLREDIRTLENMIVALSKAGTSPGAGAGRPAAGGKSSDREAARKPDLRIADSDKGFPGMEEGYTTDERPDPFAELGNVRGTGCISQEALRYARAQDVSLDQDEGVLLSVGTENPSATEGQTVAVKYYLAEDVRANDVLDAGGLKVGFDFEKSLYYVFKDEVYLEPDEKKTFEIRLKNKWFIDKFSLLTLKVHADDMVMALRGREEFETARRMDEKIQAAIDGLLEREGHSGFTEEFIASFQKDKETLEGIREDVKKMEDEVIKAGAVPAMTSREKERLCEDVREGKVGSGASGDDGSDVMKEFRLVAGTIFKGKSPSTAATWKIISGIVIFLGVLSATFYYVQIKAQKSTMLDVLTGVFSRGYITERFREELRIARETKTKCSLLVLDIDKFKKINDTYGHAVGDTILKEFVIAVRKGVRATDMVGRFGGDEFLIVLPTSDKERARKIAEGIVRLVEKHAIRLKDQSLSITTSMGVATFPDDSGTADDMFNKADGALYETKRRGGNGVTAV